MHSKKQHIIQSFEKMDITMLEMLLDDFRTYQDTTKEIFLQKIEDIFRELKNEGNTLLISYKGVCDNTDCENKGKCGYSFIANNSGKHLDLIFDETETDYTDVYHCSGFKMHQQADSLNQLIDLNIYQDETVDFKPTADFLVLSHNCKNAVEELSHYSISEIIIDKSVYEEWCIKYNELYFECKDYCDDSLEYSTIAYRDFDTFCSLYQTIGSLVDYLQLAIAANTSITEYPVIDNEDDFPLLQWLAMYEDLRDLISQMAQLISIRVEKTILFYRVKCIDLKISMHDFDEINRFNQLFDKPYEMMLDKYTTFKDSDLSRMHWDKNIADNHSSLSYHLRMRRII